MLVATAPIDAYTFFTSGSTGELNPMEVSTVYEVLGTDSFYSGSYKLQRYDDLTKDQNGNSIRGVVGWQPVNPGDTEEAGLRAEQTGNCFLLTGSWKANTRYQMVVRTVNTPSPDPIEVPVPPPPPAASPPPRPPSPPPRPPGPPGGWPPNPPPLATGPSPPPPGEAVPPPPPVTMFVVNNATPIMWIAPVTYTVNTLTWNTGLTLSTLLFSIRANKYGAACPMRTPITPYMGTMFDACAESRKRGLGPPASVNATVSECLRLLRAVANLPGNRGTVPFINPPLTPYNLTSFREAGCPAPNTVLGPRLGGECVYCGQWGYAQGRTCVCPATILPNLVGTTACGDPISVDNTTTSVEDLPAWLCAKFTLSQKQWQEKRLVAHNVVKFYLQAFVAEASPVLDQTQVDEQWQEFNATMLFDDRRPWSPTRTRGIKPNCNKCTNGKFKNTWSQTDVPIIDFSYDAWTTFRFIGYVLDKVLNYPCKELWDSANPMEWGYGYYEKVPCTVMPTQTCCGANFEGDPNFVPPRSEL
ncbi:hypothetical protein HYH03_012166 [Edaphochlamys debaryana]|uniref:Uncharacterized protein n=1 Tax=Edaphochlamys debaryana TaxID=47281 RepID=A0A835XVX3_9CHLO|nr:hypothetical protein HYH03_012166 [Edaphochlamys debaryana]|eukprot:KAG2489336.1 hypothetical protein HYH03_012166 [Edaphochlamys debaryana]